jgi:hypothetical protein
MIGIELRDSDGRLIGVIQKIEPLKTVSFTCSKHGEVKGHLNANGDVYCPECVYVLPPLSQEHVDKLSRLQAELKVTRRISIGS